MNTASRKQREIAARETLILDCASQLLNELGYQALTMDRIADMTEYSKGTIYQHFDCKEDVLAGLCLRSSEVLLSLFQRASALERSPRERLMAVSFAYQLFIQLHPLEFANMQTLKSETVREKTSQTNRCAMQDRESSIIGTVSQIVREGVDNGDLTLPPGLNSEELVFCLWAMLYGAANLGSSGIPFTDYGVPDIPRAVQRFSLDVLDAFHWRPTSDDIDYNAWHKRLEDEVFKAEMQRFAATHQLKQSGNHT